MSQAERPTVRTLAPPGPRAGVALFGYVLLSILFTWPLVAHLTDSLPLGNNDLWQNLWNFWHWQTSLTETGTSPYWTDLLFYPWGTSLAFHTHSEANIFIGFPLALIWGPVAALNFTTLLGFVIAGWGAYLLVREEVVDDRRAAFLAGIIFAYFPQHFEQSLEHLNLASYGMMPIFLFTLLRACRQGGLFPWALASLCFALNSLFAWHNSVLILPLALLLFGRELLRTHRSRRALVLEASIAGIFAFLFVLPCAYPMLLEMLGGETYYLKPKPPVPKSIDPLFLLVPAENHSLWGSLVSPIYEGYRTYPSAGFTAYLGWFTLVLAAMSWVHHRTQKFLPADSLVLTGGFSLGFWSVIFLVYLLFSFGDELRIAGKGTGIPMPFTLLDDVPLLQTIRVPNRLLVPTMLALSLLAARGAHLTLLRFRRPRLLACLMATVILLDFLWLPYPLREVDRPAWTQKLAEVPAGALLNIPGGDRARASRDMYLQTLHGRPIIGGYVSCTPPRIARRVEEYPFLKTIFRAMPEMEVEVRQALPRLLDDLPIAVVAVHLGRVREDLEKLEEEHRGRPEARLYNPDRGIRRAKLEEIRTRLRAEWGEPYYRDRQVELYLRPARRDG